jgi:16S rRNA G966 N2-methylase RsmD
MQRAFSAYPVEYLFLKYEVKGGRILGLFAGSGAVLFVSSVMGIDADGIELLPIG